MCFSAHRLISGIQGSPRCLGGAQRPNMWNPPRRSAHCPISPQNPGQRSGDVPGVTIFPFLYLPPDLNGARTVRWGQRAVSGMACGACGAAAWRSLWEPCPSPWPLLPRHSFLERPACHDVVSRGESWGPSQESRKVIRLHGQGKAPAFL